ncbi:MAG: hypothetical protein QXD59_02945 [Candidatus Caldarchaeum sp.]
MVEATKPSPLELEIRYGPFTHLMPREVPIWRGWLLGEGAKYAPYDYDVMVGEGIELPPETTDFERRIAQILTSKRIDAVSRLPGTVHIFEVKPRAGLAAIGQVLGYVALYREKFGRNRKVQPWIITDEFQPDVKPLLDRFGINGREVQPYTP